MHFYLMSDGILYNTLFRMYFVTVVSGTTKGSVMGVWLNYSRVK